MAEQPNESVEPEPAPKPRAETGWGRLSTFMLGLALGAVLGLAATPVGRGALIPARWFAALNADEDRSRSPAPPQVATPARARAVQAAAPAATVLAASKAATIAEPPPQLRAPIAGEPLVVGVFGDSMADGLWAGLYRKLHSAGGYQVVKFSQTSTGLARYDYVDLQEKTRADLDGRTVDVAVLMIGTNDEQGIAKDGRVYDFGTPEWRAIYEARIDALVDLLRSRGAAVYWVGLPKMERKGFDARAAQLNGILSARMSALGVPFIPTEPVTVNEKGEYDDYLARPGSVRKVLVRARDGIHMTMAGYLRIAAPVAARLTADVAVVSMRSAGAVSVGAAPGAGAAP